ncbi:MAG: hypothetical protein PHV75_02700 [Victivallaceae bacterium]|nr:hypothetical protein [Victivallaceae bacterium]MDD3117319.1 hypothetical protein [Victivallaceae bacterium]MDD3704136.1 hypothetical protein [Victivallaceae bacterium]MDD4317408.1 hypothetical protein [Victivallaceae bacterium]MDD5663394.1 hypothetical protein [Victivallaceae bacterium]
MILPAASEIKKIDTDNIAVSAELDAIGFPVAPGEDFTAYTKRVEGLLKFREKVISDLQDTGYFELDKDFRLPAENLISDEIIDEAASITRLLYGFEVRWVPGFFLSQSLGLLWGGCSFSNSSNYLNVFLVRFAFATRMKWFLYRRDELIAHELCHAVRSRFDDNTYEEYFAYQTSPKVIRRYLGGCFRTRADAIFFLVPIMVLLSAQIFTAVYGRVLFPIWPFWIFSSIYPAFLLIRNHFERKYISRAAAKLKSIGVTKPLMVLFRATAGEIKYLSSCQSDEQVKAYISGLARHELRWQVISWRFINGDSKHNG